MTTRQSLKQRILIIDDNQSIHNDFREVLMRTTNRRVDLDEDARHIFDAESESSEAEGFEVDSVLQGQEGLERIRSMAEAGCPYALAFVDLRMPPGWDGIETIQRLWEISPDLQVVICTAHLEQPWHDRIDTLKPTDNLLVLKKPYDHVEVLQMARVLTRKWWLSQQISPTGEPIGSGVEEEGEERARSESQLHADPVAGLQEASGGSTHGKNE